MPVKNGTYELLIDEATMFFLVMGFVTGHNSEPLLIAKSIGNTQNGNGPLWPVITLSPSPLWSALVRSFI